MTLVRPQSLLVTTDFSANAQHAFPYAVALANRFDARLTLLHVMTQGLEHLDPETVSPVMDARVLAAENEARRALAAVDVRGIAAPRLKRRVVCAPAASGGILAAARQHDVDLIVMSTHGRGVIGSMLFGSVTQRVVQQAPCAVLCVKSHESGMLDPARQLHVERILVASGRSAVEAAAFDLSMDLAREYGAAVHVMDMEHPKLAPVFFPEGMMTYVEGPAYHREVASRAQEFERKAARVGVDLHLASDDLAHEGSLADYAKAHDIDLILIRRNSRGELPFALTGGTHRLMHEVRCPLLVA